MHLVCSNDDIRPNMQCVHIENGIATAIDGHSLVRYDLRDILEENVLQHMEGKLIHKDAWKLMCETNVFFIQIKDEHLTLTYFKSIRDCDVRIGYVNEKYPNFHAITQDVLSGEFVEAKERISFNARIFERVTKVLGHPDTRSEYRFWFNQGNKAITITNVNNDNAVAILMPVNWIHSTNDRDIFAKFIKP